MNTHIFIPSKSRADSAKLLMREDLPSNVTVIVEPQDEALYKAHYPTYNFVTLPENNKGITYVRNFIKQYTENNSIHAYWQLDDDINGFFTRQGRKMIKHSLTDCLIQAETQFKSNDIALGALEYQQLAWSATKDLALNGYADVCVWVDNTKTFGMRYDAYVEGKEDRDLAIQVINSGKRTGRTTLFAFSAPKNGSNDGGLREIFYEQAGREAECTRRMIEKWPGICTAHTKPDGRPDCKINWKAIGKQSVNSLFGEI